MYQLIESNKNEVIQSIPPYHIDEYLYLLDVNKHYSDESYQKRYRIFFRMNAARLPSEFYYKYFTLLDELKSNGTQSLAQVITDIQVDSKPTIQASFASKMLHIVNPSIPIYDSLVREFYFYPRPMNKNQEDRIKSIVDFHVFLKTEYQRIIDQGLLKESLTAYDKVLDGRSITDVKKIDTLIWAFMKVMRSDHPSRREVMYS